MRSPDDVFQDMESDRALRESEVRLIENITARTTDDGEQRMLRRSLVLLTYAHMEGFAKFALTAYASSINALKLPCSEVITPLVALTLTRVFAALRDVNVKHPHFANLTDDPDVHRLAREHAFIDKYIEIVGHNVEISDRALDTKYNMNSVVLKRSLYQLGLNYPIVDTHGGTINMLVGVRNAIAHGDAMRNPNEAEVKNYVTAAFAVMRFVQTEVYDALRNKSYQKASQEKAA